MTKVKQMLLLKTLIQQIESLHVTFDEISSWHQFTEQI